MQEHIDLPRQSLLLRLALLGTTYIRANKALFCRSPLTLQGCNLLDNAGAYCPAATSILTCLAALVTTYISVNCHNLLIKRAIWSTFKAG